MKRFLLFNLLLFIIFFNPNVALEFNVGYTTTDFGKINDATINTFQSGISLQMYLTK